MPRGKSPFGRIILLILLLSLAVQPLLLPAQQDTSSTMDQDEVERQLALLKRSIADLRARMEQSRAEHRSEQAQLRVLDLAIQATVRELRELERKKALHVKELTLLEMRREKQAQALEGRQAQLGKQIKSMYRLASQSRLKLVLNQDSPAQLSRMLAYYNHINNAQADKIKILKSLLSELESTYQLIHQELSLLEIVRKKQEQILEQQQQQRSERESLLAALTVKIDHEQSRLSELEHDRQDLELLLEKLSDVLADIPPDLGTRQGLTAQKGKLPMPVKSRVVHAFGQQRAAGMKWQGWILAASAGAEVSNIAYGRVAFADWLRGYGLLMIIDHGQGFMSLYGYNESLLWEVGAWVEPGAVIATVGSNPGGDQGLYFELRKDGKAVDPAAWLKR